MGARRGAAGRRMTGPLLSVRGLTKRFGGLLAVEAVDFDLFPGEILGVIGPNGAGKTTTFNLIAGRLPATAGAIALAGEAILGLPPHAIAARGLMRTFQHNMPFAGMSVLDNVLVGAHTKMRAPLWQLILAAGRGHAEERQAREEAERMLDFVGLAGLAAAEVTSLSFGQGRLLEIARALAGKPRVILFDEPAAGLTSVEMSRLAEIIRGISGRGISVLLIEHDMKFLLPLAQRVIVLNFGAKIADGAPSAITRDHAVVEAYLGEGGGVVAPAAARC
jgi:ABC-type branched-subunit amino acid transport system ATPase component